ncbi:UDP-glucose dehydrogenase family protein [Ectobacillus ponti]|uniref:UDP-glucose 6-dehydrogenase n=1 Tax=Ectobacillus ponti TaxID=2961894 RepID=A0AA42BNG2_9BACI|nr:UDP-glucose/GDP-mannose dehydrogenase family protein [Ectobacillus ponti]MCP8967632.1 UDP-glucose/GDP-mannose dehydrogenase family protein [Ectobacillus ponti]
MKVTVIGTGYVGLVTAVGLAKIGHTVIGYDVDPRKAALLQRGEVPIYEPGLAELMQECRQEGRLLFTDEAELAYREPELVFIAVGTPPKADGSADLTYIEQVCRDIGRYMDHDAVVVTKSTVPVGTNDHIQGLLQAYARGGTAFTVVSNPEFLREGTGVHDFFNGDRIVIGTSCDRAAGLLEELYAPLGLPLFHTDIRSAEMIKYASNAFLAAKISFINEISNICEKVDADIESVAFGMGLDRRIGPQFLKAGIGYGGSCFPKDTKALVQIAGHVQHDFQLLKAVIEVNNKQQASLVKKAKEVLELKGKRAALLGLAFKPNTDDMREAPSLAIAEQLLEAGADVIAYDPEAAENARRVLPEQVQYASSLQEALQGADVAFIVTEWAEIVELPLSQYAELMREPLVFDGRNCYSLEEAGRHDLYYCSIGRRTVAGHTMSI